MPHRQVREHDRPTFTAGSKLCLMWDKVSPRGRKALPERRFFVNRRSKLLLLYGDYRHRGWWLRLGSFSMRPQPLSKADSRLAAKARTSRRKIGLRDIDFETLISLTTELLRAHATLAKETISSSNSEIKEAASLRDRLLRQIRKKQVRERRLPRRPLRLLDRFSNSGSLTRKTAFVLRLQSNLQITERDQQLLAKDVESVSLGAIR
jgi:hypothetical protein